MITTEHKLRYLETLHFNMQRKVDKEPEGEFKSRMQADVNIVAEIIKDYKDKTEHDEFIKGKEKP